MLAAALNDNFIQHQLPVKTGKRDWHLKIVSREAKITGGIGTHVASYIFLISSYYCQTEIITAMEHHCLCWQLKFSSRCNSLWQVKMIDTWRECVGRERLQVAPEHLLHPLIPIKGNISFPLVFLHGWHYHTVICPYQSRCFLLFSL